MINLKELDLNDDFCFKSAEKELTQQQIEDIRSSYDQWDYISYARKLSEDFIREFEDKLVWDYISIYQVLSEEIIREFQDKVNWTPISYHQVLSESFIREFSDKVDWFRISKGQILSKEFCFEFYEKIHWLQLYRRNKLYKGYFDNAPKAVKLYIALKYKDLRKYL